MRVTLPLAGQGLVLVRGRNLVAQAADANGVGKTSIVNAVASALFGEDLAGRVADAVACRFTTGTCVLHAELEDSLGAWTITRTRRPAKLSTTGIAGVLANEDSRVLQKKIEQRLGFGLRTFASAVVFGQGAFDRFAQADQDEQMRMLDEIQGVDYRGHLERAREWREGLRGKLAESQLRETTERVRADAAAASVAEMTRARAAFDEVKEERLASIAARREAILSRVDLVERDIASAAAEVLGLEALLLEIAKLAPLEARAAECKEKAATAKAEVSAREYEQKLAASKAADARVALVAFKSKLEDLLSGGACPACRRDVATRREEVRSLFDAELAALTGAEAAAVASLEVVGRGVDAARLVLAAANKSYDVAAEGALAQDRAIVGLVPAGQGGVDDYVARLREMTGEPSARRREKLLADARRDLAGVDRERDEESARVWDGAEALEAVRGRAATASEALAAAVSRSARVFAAVALSDYWVEAFGDRGIRSMLVAGVADYVNERLAAHLEKLTCGEATTRMSAQTAAKSGKVRDRISFVTDWSWGGTGSSDGSGGMDRRRDLAVFAAVRDLAESRSARPFPLKVLDEPGDNLDARGKEMFLRWVESEARSRGTGLLITHDEAIASQADPDAVWTVVMERGGARVDFGG